MTSKKRGIEHSRAYPIFVELAIREAAFYLNYQAYRYDYNRWEPEVALYWCDFRERNRDVLISMALSGWTPAHALLTEMSLFLTKLGEPLPLWLQEYVVASAHVGGIKPRRGLNPVANAIRDLAIAATVELVAERHRTKHTRSCGTERESACSIVAQSLSCLGTHMSESRVVSIWQAHERSKRERQRRVDAAESAGERALIGA
jgi:hypothetical protein